MEDIWQIITGISTVITIASAVYAYVANIKRRNAEEMYERDIKRITNVYQNNMHTIYEIAYSAYQQSDAVRDNVIELRLQQLQRALGQLGDIVRISARYIGEPVEGKIDLSTYDLLKRGIIWDTNKIGTAERSPEVTEVWIVSPDLKPDISEPAVGRLVKENLEAGKNYTYFFPKEIIDIDKEVGRMKRNIGIDNGELNDSVRFIPVEGNSYSGLFSGGNILLLFTDIERFSPPRVFEEIIFERLMTRGSYWQELSEERSKMLRKELLPIIDLFSDERS